MAQIKVDLDSETTIRLARRAAEERRPMPWQAEVMLRQALSIQAPADTTPERTAAHESA